MTVDMRTRHGRSSRLSRATVSLLLITSSKEVRELVLILGIGGLTNAMRAVASAGGIEVSWIGTLGFPTDALPANTREHIDDHMLNEYQSEVVYVLDKDLDGHYKHYCKTILWPIFHYQVSRAGGQS